MAVGLMPTTISIKKSWMDDYHIGITDLPEHYQDFLNHPGDFDELRRIELAEDIQKWFSEGDFILWWDEDYHLDKYEDVSSS